jgi:hypothetical protein
VNGGRHRVAYHPSLASGEVEGRHEGLYVCVEPAAGKSLIVLTFILTFRRDCCGRQLYRGETKQHRNVSVGGSLNACENGKLIVRVTNLLNNEG